MPTSDVIGQRACPASAPSIATSRTTLHQQQRQARRRRRLRRRDRSQRLGRSVLVPAPAIVVMASSGMIVVKPMVPMPLGVMVGAVLGPTVKAFLMRPFMPSFGSVMESLVPSMVAGMPVVVVMGETWCGWKAHDKGCGRQERRFADGHCLASLAERSVLNRAAVSGSSPFERDRPERRCNAPFIGGLGRWCKPERNPAPAAAAQMP